MTDVVIVYGGIKANSRLNVLTSFAKKHLEASGYTHATINVVELPAYDLITANFDNEEIIKAKNKVQDAHAVIVLTPVFKSAYTGVLKTFLDILPMKSLESTIVLPIVMGGSIGHLLALDYSLKPVLASLGASHIQKGVYVLDAHVINHHNLLDETAARLQKELEQFTEELKTLNHSFV